MSIIRLGRSIAHATRERQIRQAEENEARRYRSEYQHDATSDKFDTGGIASITDYETARMTGGGQLFIGIDPETGEYLYDSGDYSIQVFGLPGVGKGSTFIQTNLAHIGNDASIVCVGLSGENYRVAADYRRNQLGQLVVCDNADGLHGIETEHSVSIDVIGHIRAAAQREDVSDTQRRRMVEDLADEFRTVGIPIGPEDRGTNGWIGETARNLLSGLLSTTAIDLPHICNLPALYDFLGEPIPNQIDLILEFTTVASARTTFRAVQEEYNSGSERQVVWYFNKMREALRMYRKGAARGDALAGESFDVTLLRKRPGTLFIEASERSLDRDAAHYSRMLTCVTAQLAEAEGNVPVIFLVDESSQLPAWPLARAIRTLRKHGIRFVNFWQSQSSGEAVFGNKEFAGIMEESGARLIMSCSSERMARNIQQKAGDTTSYSRSANINRGGFGASENISERAMPRLPMADVLNMPRHGLIIDRNGMPIGKAVRQPWWKLPPYDERIKHFSEM